jgi:hypothetical protein
MVDDSPQDAGSLPDQGRARREPPTIDLQATEISAATAKPDAREADPVRPEPRKSSALFVPAIISAASGAAAAALLIAIAWSLGWPASAPSAPGAPPVSAAAVDDLASRVAGVEQKINKQPAAAPDTAATARIDALEKSVTALRGDLAGLRAQSEKFASALNDVKAAPREAAAPVDLSAVNERIGQIERATRAQSAAIAQESAKAADAKPADDLQLRRALTASLLDISVRQGDAYAATLAAAKSLAPNPDALKPLEAFAAKGVPNVGALSRELLTLVPKLSPPAQENGTTGTGIIDRLQAGAAKLVRIERTDAVGNDRAAIVSRVTAAALRNDSAEARRELKMLDPADRAAAQAWLDKADARDAALAASRQFAADAMAALTNPAN